MSSRNALVAVHDVGESAAVGDLGGEVEVGVGAGPRLKATLAELGIVRPEVLEGVDLALRHATVQMGAHVVGLRRRRVVDVAADVAVEVLALDLRDGHAPGVARHSSRSPVVSVR